MPQHGTEESSVVPHFTYKKVNHFREWLSQVQAREMSDLSAPVAAVLQELKKERMTEEEQVKLTPAKMVTAGVPALVLYSRVSAPYWMTTHCSMSEA